MKKTIIIFVFIFLCIGFTAMASEIENEKAKISFKENIPNDGYIQAIRNEFLPDKIITRYEMLTALNEIVDIEPHEISARFNPVYRDPSIIELFYGDIRKKNRELVDLFYGAGVIDWFDGNDFLGNQGIARADFIKILSIITGINPSREISGFSDVINHKMSGCQK